MRNLKLTIILTCILVTVVEIISYIFNIVDVMLFKIVADYLSKLLGIIAAIYIIFLLVDIIDSIRNKPTKRNFEKLEVGEHYINRRGEICYIKCFFDEDINTVEFRCVDNISYNYNSIVNVSGIYDIYRKGGMDLIYQYDGSIKSHLLCIYLKLRSKYIYYIWGEIYVK